MSRYAKVENGIVTTVISANEDYFTNLVETVPGRWIETFKDTSSRKNYAGIGFTYDVDRDAFIPPKPHDSWVLDEDTCRWEPPVDYPADYETVLYSWNEETTSWVAE